MCYANGLWLPTCFPHEFRRALSRNTYDGSSYERVHGERVDTIVLRSGLYGSSIPTPRASSSSAKRCAEVHWPNLLQVSVSQWSQVSMNINGVLLLQFLCIVLRSLCTIHGAVSMLPTDDPSMILLKNRGCHVMAICKCILFMLFNQNAVYLPDAQA